MTLETSRLRVEFKEPGVHPFMTVAVPGAEGWVPAVILGARQLRYSHKGASFPRIISGGDEVESEGGPETTSRSKANRAFRENRGGFELSTEIELEADLPMIQVVHRLKATRDLELNRAFDRFDFVAAPEADSPGGIDYSFVPHLRPEEDMVIGDHAFRSPVIMMEKDGVFFALLPDLRLLESAYREGDERYYLDFVVTGGENMSPAVCFGLGRTRPVGHVYFDSRFRNSYLIEEGRTLTLAYQMVVDHNGFGRSDVIDFLWERYGREHLRSGLPQVAGWDRFASAGLGRMFKKSDLFKRFEMDGQPCGGTIAIHLLNRRGVRLMNLRQLNGYLRFQDLFLFIQHYGLEKLTERPWGARLLERAIYRHGPKVPPQIMFQSWFNNLRSAYGAYWFARKWDDSELLERAVSVKNLAILAPREDGAFPAVCYFTDEGVYWSRGTRAFKHVDWYHTADCATTAYYMAMWFTDHEGDPRLLYRCREFAEFLLKVQLPSGAFPAWVQPAEPEPIAAPELRESATTACPAMFLAMLYLSDRDPRFLESAVRACDFLAEEVIGEQKWFDYETFYSCSRKRLGLYDAYTGTFPQNTMSMYWAAEAYRLLYILTGEKKYLRIGTEVLDHLCLYQQAWDPPFLSIDAFGGFGVMNTDGEWNDSRQALFAPLLMEYYRLNGKRHYMERGIAALRASFALMYLEENRNVAPGNMTDFHQHEMGSVAENYGHFGYDHRTSGYLESDWGPGSACQAAAYVQNHFGDIFVDTDRTHAFGINGCRVDGIRIDGGKLILDVHRQVRLGTEASLKVAGSVPVTAVEVNGKPASRTPAGDYKVMI